MAKPDGSRRAAAASARACALRPLGFTTPGIEVVLHRVAERGFAEPIPLEPRPSDPVDKSGAPAIGLRLSDQVDGGPSTRRGGTSRCVKATAAMTRAMPAPR